MLSMYVGMPDITRREPKVAPLTPTQVNGWTALYLALPAVHRHGDPHEPGSRGAGLW